MSTVLLKINGGCYTLVMETMEVISLRMPKALRDAMTAVAAKLDETEGQFIRKSVAARLEKEGSGVPDDVLKRKSRKGVGGRPTHRTIRQDPKGTIPKGGPHSFSPAPTGPIIPNERGPIYTESPPPGWVASQIDHLAIVPKRPNPKKGSPSK